MRNDTLLALDQKFKHIHTLDSISGLLGWDELVNLPPESADQRCKQSAAIAGLCHTAFIDPEVRKLFSKLKSEFESLDREAQIVVH